ncbi:GNAT family N-acetyltransferase [Halarcobacter anaerophilus]|jgi:putative acetyltransferase|uniref:GNAT family N-acetyltransferase n=1 Tax=Halarcobacter anaerophilus TaxID=877500 RepID=A0A4Q0Y3N1_9BACT|nr:GNAT family N-acetyltransferase [Halarcobacter anaerophilus]QDF28540.1 putative acetyltransferase [Halarcobacter anaerophilus]RXJ63269.1 GNAT family N-acetyltransferase [Halarcobacter anaerophilus]
MITRVKESEYKTLTTIWEDSVRATHTFLSDADINFFKPKIMNEYLYAVKLFAYKDEAENICGFIGIDENRVEMLFIHSKYFKKGIGKRLLEYAIKSYGINELDVNEQNEDAVAFYNHFGFKVIGRSQTDEFGKPFPLLHMELK